MRLRNLTPHPITFRTPDGDITLPSEGVVRVDCAPGILRDMGFPVPVADPDQICGVSGLPDPEDGVFLIVSAFVGTLLAGTRSDLLVPGTGPKDGVVRDDNGRIVAVTRLKKV